MTAHHDEQLTSEEVAEVRRRVVDLQCRRNLQTEPKRSTWWIDGPCNGLCTNENVRPDGHTIELVVLTSHGPERVLYEVEGHLLKFKELARKPK